MAGARHRRSGPAQYQAASVCPSGENVTYAGIESSFNDASSRRVTTFQSFIVPSVEAEASVLPFGVKASEFTASLCPRCGGISFHVVVSQNLIELSVPHVASVIPSGE